MSAADYWSAVVAPVMREPVQVPDDQAARDEAFSRAVRAGDSRTAGLLAHHEPLPADADTDELARWRKRQKLYPAFDARGGA